MTTVASSAVSKEKYLLFLGTSYGASSLSTFDKGEDSRNLVYKFKENFGNMLSLCLYNNALTFSYGKSLAKTDSIESSSNKLATKCDLNTVLDEIKDPEAKFRKLQIFPPSEGLKSTLEKFGVNV